MEDKIIISFTDETVTIKANCSGQELFIGTLAIIKELAKMMKKEVPEVIDFLKVLAIKEVEQTKEGEH